MSPNGTVAVSLDRGVCHLVLDRPERLNAVVPALVEDLLAGLGRAASQDAVAVVISGNGRAFCAGHDLKEPEPEEDIIGARRRLQRMQDITRVIRSYPGVVIAAVHGYALGAGCELALGCDLVVAGEDARFGFPEVGVGLSVTNGVSVLLPAAVGLARAKEMVLLGERITAMAARDLGLVNRLTAVGEHVRVADELATHVLARPRAALLLAKSVLDQGGAAGLDLALEREVEHALLSRTTGEAATGRTAFGERR